MDTGSYMANQMDNLIESGLREMDAFIDDMYIRIESFIKENGYDWKSEQIVKAYTEDYSKGHYVCYSLKKVIENFKEDLSKATGIYVQNK